MARMRDQAHRGDLAVVPVAVAVAVARGQHPGVLEPAALRRVDDHLPGHRRVPGQARIPHMGVLPGDHERAQVAFARAGLAGGRVDHLDVAELDDLLGDEAPRLGLDPVGQLLARRMVQAGAEHHAVPAGLGHVLDHEFAEPVEHLAPVGLEHRHVRRRVVEDGLLAEIVLDHLRHEIVDRLVVGRPVARRVDDRDVARTVCGQQAGHADHRIGVERERIQVLVGQAAVHRADAVAPARIVEEVQLVLLDLEVLGKRQRRAGLLRQIRVLEEGGIVPARGQHHGDALGGDEIHGLAQQARVVAVVAHMHLAEQLRVRAPLDVAREQRVARARGDAQVVLEHPPAPVLALHQVLAGDMREDAAGRRHAVDLREVAGRGVHILLGHHAVVDDPLVGVHVLEIGVERVDALLEPGLQVVELVGFDDARDRVVREQPVMVFAVLVHAEPHAVAAQLAVDRLSPVDQLTRQFECRLDHVTTPSCQRAWRPGKRVRAFRIAE